MFVVQNKTLFFHKHWKFQFRD